MKSERLNLYVRESDQEPERDAEARDGNPVSLPSNLRVSVSRSGQLLLELAFGGLFAMIPPPPRENTKKITNMRILFILKGLELQNILLTKYDINDIIATAF
jgi:hypothetical protein